MTETAASTLDFLAAEVRRLRDELHEAQLALAETEARLEYRTAQLQEAQQRLHNDRPRSRGRSGWTLGGGWPYDQE